MIRFADDLSGQPPLVLNGTDLTVADVVAVARHRRRVTLSPDAATRMARCRAMVEVLLEASIKVYGLTTGFGKLRDVVIEPSGSSILVANQSSNSITRLPLHPETLIPQSPEHVAEFLNPTSILLWEAHR